MNSLYLFLVKIVETVLGLQAPKGSRKRWIFLDPIQLGFRLCFSRESALVTFAGDLWHIQDGGSAFYHALWSPSLFWCHQLWYSYGLAATFGSKGYHYVVVLLLSLWPTSISVNRLGGEIKCTMPHLWVTAGLNRHYSLLTLHEISRWGHMSVLW